MRRECVVLERCSRARHTASGMEMSRLVIWGAGLDGPARHPNSPYGQWDRDVRDRHT
ncbi:hypothetical protein F2Q69_00013035 [Brassica cretica]|uniref:Uncharacterized protein n=1 Tax=Brassica cretica TaxID=69181 RepID=A0A8S9R1B6_BRACR|nr:hypothetical protein F2Q69_00013035 [Brassica cretica]